MMRFELRCPACQATTVCGPPEMAARLRQAGKLRRAAEPEEDLLAELFRSAAPQFTCDGCGKHGLVAAPLAEEAADWGGSRPCEACGQPIPAERLELFPQTKLCPACQRQAESGIDTAEPEFCPKCGSIMTLRQTRARGVTQYVMTCPECRR